MQFMKCELNIEGTFEMVHRHEREGLEAARAVVQHQLNIWLIKRNISQQHPYVYDPGQVWQEANGIVVSLERACVELGAAISQSK